MGVGDCSQASSTRPGSGDTDLMPSFCSLNLQGGQQQRGPHPGGGQQAGSAAAALHAPPGRVGPRQEDVEVRLRGVLGEIQLARRAALQGAAGHRRGAGHAPEPHLHPPAGGPTEEPLLHHVTQRAPSARLASGAEREKKKDFLSK